MKPLQRQPQSPGNHHRVGSKSTVLRQSRYQEILAGIQFSFDLVRSDTVNFDLVQKPPPLDLFQAMFVPGPLRPLPLSSAESGQPDSQILNLKMEDMAQADKGSGPKRQCRKNQKTEALEGHFEDTGQGRGDGV